jgi:hypothetical protein
MLKLRLSVSRCLFESESASLGGRALSMPKMIPPNDLYEMLTAAINRFTMANADMEWDAKIGGRQFDVVATITSGMYKVVIGFEVTTKRDPFLCKNR